MTAKSHIDKLGVRTFDEGMSELQPIDLRVFIHIDWEGPHRLEDIPSFDNQETDFGLYQVYGAHPVYGSNVLLYIGKASKHTFAARLTQEMRAWEVNSDAGRIEIYLGRLWGLTTPSEDEWCRQIDLAERLLIYAHEPAQNTQKSLLQSMEGTPFMLSTGHRYRDLLPRSLRRLLGRTYFRRA